MALIIGIFGFLRLTELDHFQFKDLQKKDDVYVGSVLRRKRKGPKRNSEFIISGEKNCKILSDYLGLFPADKKNDKLMKSISKGMVVCQNIGRNMLGKIPSKIAIHLGLENPAEYTSHTFRRTAATLLVDTGASVETLKRAGGWLSSTVAEGYVDASLVSRKEISERLVGAPTISSVNSSTVESNSNQSRRLGDNIKMSHSSTFMDFSGASKCVVNIFAPKKRPFLQLVNDCDDDSSE